MNYEVEQAIASLLTLRRMVERGDGHVIGFRIDAMAMLRLLTATASDILAARLFGFINLLDASAPTLAQVDEMIEAVDEAPESRDTLVPTLVPEMGAAA